MATKKAADEPQSTDEPDPAKVAEDQAKADEQADADRDAVAQAAQEAEGPTVIPANFEDTAAHGRVAEAAAEDAAPPADEAKADDGS